MDQEREIYLNRFKQNCKNFGGYLAQQIHDHQSNIQLSDGELEYIVRLARGAVESGATLHLNGTSLEPQINLINEDFSYVLEKLSTFFPSAEAENLKEQFGRLQAAGPEMSELEEEHKLSLQDNFQHRANLSDFSSHAHDFAAQLLEKCHYDEDTKAIDGRKKKILDEISKALREMLREGHIDYLEYKLGALNQKIQNTTSELSGHFERLKEIGIFTAGEKPIAIKEFEDVKNAANTLLGIKSGANLGGA